MSRAAGVVPLRRVVRLARRRDERGAATLMVVAVTGLLVFVLAGLAVVAGIVLAQRQAQAAADLAALGGATAQADGRDACAVAAGLAADNGGLMASCAVTGEDVTVTVRVTGPESLGRTWDRTARARAGPAS